MGDKIYDRQNSDTDKSWLAFCKYRDMGGDRSLEKYRQKYAENRPANYINILKLWSAKHKWGSYRIRVKTCKIAIKAIHRKDFKNMFFCFSC